MNTILNRLNAVTALATSTILCLVAVVALISYPTHKPSGHVEVHSLQVVQGQAQWHMDRHVQDFVKLQFDVDADFSPLFNWNTKQVFLSLAAQYEGKRHAANNVVVWDRIIRRKGDAHVKLQDANNKYGFREVSRSFENVTSTTFTLKWNVMPHVGILAYGDEARTGELEVPKKVVPVIEEGARRPRPEKMWF